jgi:hypothetical protein
MEASGQLHAPAALPSVTLAQVAKDWKKILNKKINNFHLSSNIIYGHQFREEHRGKVWSTQSRHDTVFRSKKQRRRLFGRSRYKR